MEGYATLMSDIPELYEISNPSPLKKSKTFKEIRISYLMMKNKKILNLKSNDYCSSIKQ